MFFIIIIVKSENTVERKTGKNLVVETGFDVDIILTTVGIQRIDNGHRVTYRKVHVLTDAIVILGINRSEFPVIGLLIGSKQWRLRISGQYRVSTHIHSLFLIIAVDVCQPYGGIDFKVLTNHEVSVQLRMKTILLRTLQYSFLLRIT